MNDRLFSSWVLVVGALGFGYYYYRLSHKTLGPVPGSKPIGPPVPPEMGTGQTPLQRLLGFAESMGLRVYSTTRGRHVTGSLHYQGRAIDTGLGGHTPEEVQSAAEAQGFRVLPELYKGWGRYGYSSGPHMHIEVPFQRSSLDIDGGESNLAYEVG
jgi:hypothetical protein